MEGIKYVNFIEISPAFIEIRRVKNSVLVVPVTHLCAAHLPWPLPHNHVS